MFEKHYYNVGGKTYKQDGGGPIGLRGTCAVARLAMQLFDCNWKNLLNDWRITTWLISQYMDDIRAFLPGIKKGWRVTERGMEYCERWEEEDDILRSITK